MNLGLHVNRNKNQQGHGGGYRVQGDSVIRSLTSVFFMIKFLSA